MIGLENNPYDFFGIGRKKTRTSISYLGLTPVKISNKPNSQLAVVNFIGKPIPFTNNQRAGRPIRFLELKPLYKKESTKQKRLSKWGDADMDGSPNYFDCDPHNFLKDAKRIPKDIAKDYGKKENKNTLEAQIAAAIKSGKPGRRRLSREEKVSRARAKTEESIRRFSGAKIKGKYTSAELAAEEAILRGKIPKAKYIKNIAEGRSRQILTMKPKVKAKETERYKVYETQEKKLVIPFKTKTQLKDLKQDEGIKMQAYENEYYLKHKKWPSEEVINKFKQKELKELYEYEKATSPEAMKDIEEKREVIRLGKKKEKTIGMELAEHEAKVKRQEDRRERVERMAERVKRVLTGKAAIDALKRIEIHPSAIIEKGKQIAKGAGKALTTTYGKEERIATQKVRRLVKSGLGTAFGGALLQTKFGPAIKGRPGGPSGKYMIEGKPVYEEEYSKWAAEQRALNRLTPSTTQQAPIAETTEQQLTAENITQQQEQSQYPTETSPMSAGQIDATKYTEPFQRGPTEEELKMAQEIAQQQDNVLNAPNILKGELKATGGSLLTSTGPQIMDAPNAFKGQLRTLNRGDPASIGEIHLSERPQTNPYGDEYVDIDLGSGKPRLKKRPSERWIDGRAL